MKLYDCILKYTMTGYIISFKDNPNHMSIRIQKEIGTNVTKQWNGTVHYQTNPPIWITEERLVKEIEKGVEILNK